MNKICPYLAAAWLRNNEYDTKMFPTSEDDETLYCVKERCEMWSTTMKACSLRNFWDVGPSDHSKDYKKGITIDGSQVDVKIRDMDGSSF